MNPLEVKRIIFEIKRVETAKMEQELKIMERQEEIDRLRENIKVQDDRIAELQKKLQDAGASL